MSRGGGCKPRCRAPTGRRRGSVTRSTVTWPSSLLALAPLVLGATASSLWANWFGSGSGNATELEVARRTTTWDFLAEVVAHNPCNIPRYLGVPPALEEDGEDLQRGVSEPALHPRYEALPPGAVSTPLTVQEFVREFKGRRPVIFRRPRAHTAAFAAETTRSRLLERYGDVVVTLASSNSFSHGRRTTTLTDYLTHFMAPQNLDSLANETWYLFGDTQGEDWTRLQSFYTMPLDSRWDDGILSFGAAGRFSGVSFHTHGPAFGETIHGRKRWFLTPPGVRPPFDGDQSQLQWVHRHRAAYGSASPESSSSPSSSSSSSLSSSSTLSSSFFASSSSPPAFLASLQECTVHEGEVIYVPNQWWHATLNLDDHTVFMSTFTHEPL